MNNYNQEEDLDFMLIRALLREEGFLDFQINEAWRIAIISGILEMRTKDIYLIVKGTCFDMQQKGIVKYSNTKPAK